MSRKKKNKNEEIENTVIAETATEASATDTETAAAADSEGDVNVRKNVSSLASAAASLAAAWDRESVADPVMPEAKPVEEAGGAEGAMTDEEKAAFEAELGGHIEDPGKKGSSSEDTGIDEPTDSPVDEMSSNDEGHEISEGISEDEQTLTGMNAEFSVEDATETAEIEAPDRATSDMQVAGNEAFVPEEYDLPKDLADAQAKSVIESILFASVHPVSFAAMKSVFHGTNIDSEKLTDLINRLATDYAGGDRGVALEEVAGGFQLRTKLDNAGWLKKMVKARPFRLSGPALEVLSIIAYKQPLVKAEVDQIRGVESGHLVRALMEKNLVKFAGKSELPGKPMLYATTKQFLELFGLRNIRELPTLSEIDKLIPEGIGEIDEIQGETLGGLAEKIGLPMGKSYSDSEAELLSITESLGEITTSTEFFEQEKIRERERRDNERAQDLRERKIVGEELSEVDAKWLAKFEAKIEQQLAAQAVPDFKPEDEALANAEASTDRLDEILGEAEFVVAEESQAEIEIEAEAQEEVLHEEDHEPEAEA